MKRLNYKPVFKPTYLWDLGLNGPTTNVPLLPFKRKPVIPYIRDGKFYTIAVIQIRPVQPRLMEIMIMLSDEKGVCSIDTRGEVFRRLHKALNVPFKKVLCSECVSCRVSIPRGQDQHYFAMDMAHTALTTLGVAKSSREHMMNCIHVDFTCYLKVGPRYKRLEDVLRQAYLNRE